MKPVPAKSERGPGAPTVRTKFVADRLCACIRRGMPFNMACSAVGISKSIFSQWRNEDAAFQERIEKAVAEGVDARLKKIEQASDSGDWRASAWLLEHCQPQHFAKSRIEVEAVGQFDHAFVIPRETLDQIAEARAKRERESLNGTSPAVPEVITNGTANHRP